MRLLSRVDCPDLKDESYLLKDNRILRIKAYICDKEVVLEVYIDKKETGLMQVGEEL